MERAGNACLKKTINLDISDKAIFFILGGVMECSPESQEWGCSFPGSKEIKKLGIFGVQEKERSGLDPFYQFIECV